MPDGKKTTVGELKTGYVAKVTADAETARLNAVKAAEGKADFEKLQRAAANGGTVTQFAQTAGTVAEGLKRGIY